MSEEKTFTQEHVDKVIQNRLARVRAKQAKEIEEIRNGAELPEGETDWKQVYDDNKARYLSLVKQSKLTGAGFSPDQVERYVRYIESESEEEIEAEALDIAADVLKGKPSYADPTGKKSGKWNPWG